MTFPRREGRIETAREAEIENSRQKEQERVKKSRKRDRIYRTETESYFENESQQ